MIKKKGACNNQNIGKINKPSNNLNKHNFKRKKSKIMKDQNEGNLL